MGADIAGAPPPSKTPDDGFVALATIGRPVGLDGWCRVFVLGRTLEMAPLPCALFAGRNGPEIRVTLTHLRKEAKTHKGLFREYTTLEQIDSLKNCRLFFEKERLPAPAAHEYYHYELEGAAVFDEDTQRRIGTVVRVYNYPTVDALEIEKSNGSLIIVPMTQEIVPVIDTQNKKIVIRVSAVEDLL